MANVSKRLEWNVPGNLFVDSTCIDCDTCRILSPAIFGTGQEMSFVQKQPETEEEIHSSLRALLSCPTGSIGSLVHPPELKQVRDSFPLRVEENVFYNGFHSEKSYGAFSYFIQRKEGNILIDSPRFTSSLVNRFESMGGIKYLFLTHQDDVADQELYFQHFGCQRIIHQDDKRRIKAEIVIEGKQEFSLDSDLLCLHVPGHTRGSMVLIYGRKFLFSGDHLAYSPVKSHLHAFYDACWYSWPEQILSMEKLAEKDFLFVLPGHGRRFRARDSEEMKNQMRLCLEWMRTKA